MKRILALLLALCMVFALCACGSSDTADTDAADEEETEEVADTDDADETEEAEEDEEDEENEEETEEVLYDAEDLMIGIVCVGDRNSGYDYAHIEGLENAATALGIPLDNIIFKYSVPEDETAYDACIDLVEQGCDIVFTDSYGHQDYCLQAATENPDVTFVSLTGDLAKSSGLDNYSNAFCHTFEARYVSGVVAGLKLQEMVENDELTEENYDEDGNIKIGYVGAYPFAEVISGYTAFYLGVKSIVENVVMDVNFTNSWFDLTGEQSAAQALISRGCCIISQHADSTGAPMAVQEAYESGKTVYCVGYNIDMLSVAPDCALTSANNNWEVFYTYALSCVLNGEPIATDWSEGYSTGANRITTLSDTCAEGTAEYVAEVEAAIADGSLNVFDCSTFTVDGETVTSFLVLDTDGDGVADDGEAIRDGVFYESDTSIRSAPYFSLQIDGITQLIED